MELIRTGWLSNEFAHQSLVLSKKTSGYCLNTPFVRRIISYAIVFLIFCLIFQTKLVQGQASTPSIEIIEIDLARYVASEQVHRNYPAFKWHAVDHMVLYDIEGQVNAYTFVFAKSDSKFKTAEDLRQHISEKLTQLQQVQEKIIGKDREPTSVIPLPEPIVEAEDDLYAFNDLATVITGAVSDSPLILRHFRGIPEFWVHAETLGSQMAIRLYGKTFRAIRIIMITPMDFRIAADEGKDASDATASLRATEKAVFASSTQSINMNARKVESFTIVREQVRAVEERKQQRINKLKPVERARYEQALQDRTKALSNEWQRKREAQ